MEICMTGVCVATDYPFCHIYLPAKYGSYTSSPPSLSNTTPHPQQKKDKTSGLRTA